MAMQIPRLRFMVREIGSAGKSPEAVIGREHLQGIWSYSAFAMGDHEYVPEATEKMGKMAFLVGDYLPGWDGLWACVQFGHEGNRWALREVLDSCRSRILDPWPGAPPPHPDIYLWAGGRFRVALDVTPHHLDCEQFFHSEYPFATDMKGIFRIRGDRMTLCQAETGHPRPTDFVLEGFPHRTLGELVRLREPDSHEA
jgi:hypothetical protein